MSSAIYAGSFDPFTNGHLHVLKLASLTYDKIYLVIAVNNDKRQRRTNIEDTKICIEEILIEEHISNVVIVEYSGLISSLAKELNVKFLVRGLRNGMDFEYEQNIAKVNKKLNYELETVYFLAGETDYISSSSVMEIHKLGGDIKDWVPHHVYKLLNK